eukprot:GFYU01005671.1.p1 GENE.GFYU01005671.1~~GFYU01005671.1.p1  ORF type:complete len:472 (+),score=106.08 GFYU01005671.1:139-1416(+)
MLFGAAVAQTTVTGVSCDDLYAQGVTTSGVYTVNPGSGDISVYCSMTSTGGYMRLQTTVWLWEAQSKLLDTDWATGYSTVAGDVSTLDGAYRLPFQHWGWGSSAEDHLLVARLRKKDGTSCDPLTYRVTAVSWDVTADGATLSDPKPNQPFGIFYGSSMAIATKDSSVSGSNCPKTYGAVPWTYKSCCLTCPTFKGSYWTDSPHPMINQGQLTADMDGKTVDDVCGAGTELEISRGYVGVNQMDYLAKSRKCPSCRAGSGTCVNWQCKCESSEGAGFWTGELCDQCQALYEGADCKTMKAVEGASCHAILKAGASRGDGIYIVDLDEDGPLPRQAVHCDMSMDNGGYTRLMQTTWSWSATKALQTSFADTVNNNINSPNDAAHRVAVKHWPLLSSEGNHLMRFTFQRTDGTTCGPLVYKATGAAG